MKRLLVILLCLLAVFAVVSCNQEPEEAAPSGGADENGGTITIKPASEDWGTQTGKMQFLIDYAIEAESEISFLMKATSEVTKITVRAGQDGSYVKWLTDAELSALETTDDGWLIVEVDGSKVTDSAGLGITLTVTAQTQDIEFQIKNLKIDGVLVDFSDWDATTCVGPLTGAECPTAVSATITK